MTGLQCAENAAETGKTGRTQTQAVKKKDKTLTDTKIKISGGHCNISENCAYIYVIIIIIILNYVTYKLVKNKN